MEIFNNEEAKYFCPCSELGCCANPDTYTPKHNPCIDVCEECFTTACYNCKKECSCDL